MVFFLNFADTLERRFNWQSWN